VNVDNEGNVGNGVNGVNVGNVGNGVNVGAKVGNMRESIPFETADLWRLSVETGPDEFLPIREKGAQLLAELA
jgi:hypothetical protein